MECNVREISNAVIIESMDTIIQQENRKLEMDKNTGLLAKKSKVIKVTLYLRVLKLCTYLHFNNKYINK